MAGLGVIEDLELGLHPGLNVLTGETGTGKTLVTVGLALALGRRGGAPPLRGRAGAARGPGRGGVGGGGWGGGGRGGGGGGGARAGGGGARGRGGAPRRAR